MIGAYRIEIQQGNYVPQEKVTDLKLGMSKEQVRFVLGTPLVTDIFHADRWDYIYYLKPQNSNRVVERKLTVYFKDGKLVQIDKDVVASAADATTEKDGK